METDKFGDTPLGRRVEAVSQYTPSLLFPIERQRLRERLLLDPQQLPFEGADLWTAWELTWLAHSLPVVPAPPAGSPPAPP